MNNQLVKTIIVGVLIAAAFTGLWFWYQFRLNEQLAAARTELELSQQQTDEAIKEADAYRLQAEVTEQLLEKIKADEQGKRAELLAELRRNNLLIINLKAEAVRINAEYESKLEAFNSFTPSEIADSVQADVQKINSEGTFKLTGADLFMANEPAARAIGVGLQERGKYQDLYSNGIVENETLNEELTTMRGVVDSYATELSYTQQSMDEWKNSSLAEKAARQLAQNQIQKQDAVISQLNRKLWWGKIKGPLYGLGGGVTGYLIAKGLDQN